MALTREHVLRLFDDIEENDHLYRVRFYETNSTLICSLDETEQQYFNFYYINSLFELGKYGHVLAQIDPLIEYVFTNEASFDRGDAFESLLLKKASALFHSFQYEKSFQLSKQLIGINPYMTIYQSLARRSFRAMFHWNTNRLKLMTIVVILATAACSAIFWLTQDPSQNSSMLIDFMWMMAPCLMALSVLGGSYLYAQLRSQYEVADLVVRKKAEKRTRRKKF